MKRVQNAFIPGVLLLLLAAPAFAQNGCVNSPENPTALLALVGAAGGWVSFARARRRARKGK
ncbi:MAG: PExPT-CTERM protein [Janthinobacterium lividum]